MEAKYFRNYTHSYLILTEDGDSMEKGYSCRMLMGGKVEGLLKCSVRHVNSVTCLYYDITSKVALSQMYVSQKIQRDQVCEILEQLHATLTRINSFFMEESCLILEPEYLYYDMENKGWSCVYYPGYKGDCLTLMEFFLEHADMEDRELADVVFRMYEKAEKGSFSMEEMYLLLEEKTEEEQDSPEIPQTEDVCCTDWQAESGVQTEDFMEQKSDPVKKGKNVFYAVFAVLSLLGAGGALCVPLFFELTQQEQMALWGCAAVAGACFVYSIYRLIQKKAASGSKTETRSEIAKSGQDEPQELSVDLSEVLDRNMVWGMERPDSIAGKKEPVAHKEPGPVCEETVFFDRASEPEYKLYAMDAGNKEHIRLMTFPCTIGKMAGCVDHLLLDDSVSRIHARLERDGYRVFLTDMNSTNGTYKNGLRIQPQEMVEVEPGDEIRFGKRNFCFR